MTVDERQNKSGLSCSTSTGRAGKAKLLLKYATDFWESKSRKSTLFNASHFAALVQSDARFAAHV
jgi:hypothetical protein